MRFFLKKIISWSADWQMYPIFLRESIRKIEKKIIFKNFISNDRQIIRNLLVDLDFSLWRLVKFL